MFDETGQEAWRLRYGTDAPDGLPDLGRLLNHRSVRKYDGRPIPEPVMQGLVAAAQSAATSSNLQLWTIVSVQDPLRREEMAVLCDNQAQVRDAAWFLAFVADHHRIRRAAQLVGEPANGLGYLEFFAMAVIDAALAAERMVCAAESQGIGICYIGALRNDPEGVKRLLHLPEGAFGVFGLCLGYPQEPLRSQIKPRLAQEAVWHREFYNATPPHEEYDARMTAFYEAQKMKGDVTWSMRSGRRVGRTKLTGREVLKEWLEGQGFNLE